MKKRGFNGRKAQAQIITVVLIVLLVLVAIVVVWKVVKLMIDKNTGSVKASVFTTQLKIEDVELGNVSAKVRVKRSSGKEEITVLKFIFYNEDGESVIVERNTNLPDELETKIYSFTNEEINSSKRIKKVSVVPMFNGKAGIESSKDLGDDAGLVDDVGLVEEVYDLGSEFNPGVSCLDILNGGSIEDDVYWIDPDGGGEFEVYCDMTYDGGGWTMLMKVTRGTVFNYDSNYWTTANVLNVQDITRNDGDAKYRSFNELEITDIMARWPDAGDIRWLENSAWTSRTALIGFNEYRNWGIPQEDDNWNPTYFSAQSKQCDSGPGRYGTKLKDVGGYNAGARWGYRFNENGCGNWASDDVGGGIGVWTDTNSAWRYSAGDWSNCCRSSTGMLRSARVEVYGR